MPITGAPPLGRIFGVDEGLLDVRSFFATRRAILAGEPLHALEPGERRERGFMDPWLFNLQETILATAPASLLLWFLSAVFGSPPPEAGLSGRALFRAEFMGDFEPVVGAALIPLTLLATAPLLAWASFRPGDGTPAAQRRNTAAYLYTDGAYGLWAQLVMVFCLSLATWVESWEAAGSASLIPENVRGLVSVALVLVLIPALIHEWKVLFVRVPERLFALNGYEPRAAVFRRVRHPNAGPTSRYNAMAAIGIALVSIAISGILYGVASALAWLLAFVKAAVLAAAGG